MQRVHLPSKGLKTEWLFILQLRILDLFVELISKYNKNILLSVFLASCNLLATHLATSPKG